MEIEFSDINYVALIVGVIINMVMGALWYSPVLFAKPWMAGTHLSMANMRGSAATRGYAISIAASFALTFAMASLVQLAGLDSALEGLGMGLLVGLGFVVTANAANYSFESKSRKLFLINTGYNVVSYAIIGLLLGAWR